GGHIGITAVREGPEVAVRVRDTGVGIPPEMLGRVFEPFTQVDRSLARSQGGLGIGLALVKYLGEMHGGPGGAASAGLRLGGGFDGGGGGGGGRGGGLTAASSWSMTTRTWPS